ncbi:serine hydrolase domain-containing protein [Thalassotalea euphylliae]|uniref:Class C beta-lactamase-related serine hydrolase n=1 Tax=Thalassotalea euphylliae TaxID=1655234 RepID=A0A3E0UEQ0_9GAMM|nr:serine hydrolase [Thalassotalea euphylliae]REL35356.1 class C beta-lactamase-related serine hydrolase [Thalassotalea euphylliae]
MWKWIGVVVAFVIAGVTGYWFSLDKNIRYLMLNQPESTNVLFWTTAQRDAGFQTLEKLDVIPFNIIEKGKLSHELDIEQPLVVADDAIEKFFKEQRIAGLVVLQNGDLRYEKYGLGLTRDDKWTSFSVAKSVTSTLVGAAIKDGYIKSLEDTITDYIPDLKGSAYEDVTLAQVLTMTSGVAWDEDYKDPNSDASKFNFHTPEPGVDATVSYMHQLERANPAGSTFVYSTGETSLIGLLVTNATGKSLSNYLSEKIWANLPVQQNASWLLGPTNQEISGCCIQATTRDFALFGDFVLNGAQVNGASIVPEDWFAVATSNQVELGEGDGYGFQWWTSAKGHFEGKGIFGQGLYIDPEHQLVIAVNANWEGAMTPESYQSRKAMYQYFAELFANNNVNKVASN